MSKTQGLSLIELLICLALFSLFTCWSLNLGAPILYKNQSEKIKNDIITAVHYARNMAILYDETLILAPIMATNWSLGLNLFIDNKEHRYSKKDKLYQWRWHYRGWQVYWQGFHSPHYLRFSPELKHATSSGHFAISKGSQQLKLVVNRYGRVTHTNNNLNVPD